MIKNKTPKDIPLELSRYLSAAAKDEIASTSRYVERGAELVSPAAISALRDLLPALQWKLASLSASERFAQRTELLTTYFVEACTDGHSGTPAHREAAFALLYFLKGFDRIPDTVPEIGLLDDAMIVDAVLQRNAPVLRAHWLRNRRPWPLDAY